MIAPLRQLAIDAHCVDQQMGGGWGQLFDCTQHGEPRCVINIDLIDARRVDRCNRPGDGPLANQQRQPLAALGWEQFRISQSTNPVGRIENYRRRHYRSEERSAADFVNAGNQRGALGPGELFKLERAAQLFQQS